MILIFGGTSDSLKLTEVLEKEGYDYLLSVATTFGKALATKKVSELGAGDEANPNLADSKVLEGRLDQEAMKKLIVDRGIKLILDATHPYAIEVSKNAMAVAAQMEIPYIRYERPSLLEAVRGEHVYIVKDTKEACQVANSLGKNIFLGTGSKTLGKFVVGLKDKKIIARVLPTSEVILQCEALGLTPENIVAMKGPFSEEMNAALYKHYEIDCMITKESGAEGGFLEKVEACKVQGIDVIVIKRASLDYSQVVHSEETLIEILRDLEGEKR